MNSSAFFILLTILCYLIGMLYIGFRCAKKNTSSSDFYLGGRKLGPFVTAMSAEASDMSSYLLMGLPGLAYLTGLADVGWTIIGLSVGTYLNWLFTAKRLRRYTELTGSITLPQFFSKRFHDESKILTAVAALIIIVFFIPYTASGFAACGKLFSSFFGLPYMACMIVSAIVIISYTVAGGFLAASLTDFIQSIIMTFAIFVVLFYATTLAGGFSTVIENASNLAGYISFNLTHDPITNAAKPYGFITVLSTLAWGLGYFGMPHILLRFMAIEDENKLSLSRRIATVWVIIAMAIAVLIGVIGRALSAMNIVEALSGSSSETIIVMIAKLLSSHGVFASIIAGLILAGILASTMSTADSQLLAASSSASHDILQDAMHLNLSEKGSMVAARTTVLIIAVLGVVIARNPASSIFSIVSFAWAGFGASFGPIIILSLYWKRLTAKGALCGMISGGLSVLVYKFMVRPLGGVFDIYELLPAFLIALFVAVIISFCSTAPSKEVVEEFEKVAGKEKLKK